jgi:hypothetical protein
MPLLKLRWLKLMTMVGASHPRRRVKPRKPLKELSMQYLDRGLLKECDPHFPSHVSKRTLQSAVLIVLVTAEVKYSFVNPYCIFK